MKKGLAIFLCLIMNQIHGPYAYASDPFTPRFRYETCALILASIGRSHRFQTDLQNEIALDSMKQFRRQTLGVTDNEKYTYLHRESDKIVLSNAAGPKDILWAAEFTRGLEKTLEEKDTEARAFTYRAYGAKIQGREQIEDYFNDLKYLSEIFNRGRHYKFNEALVSLGRTTSIAFVMYTLISKLGPHLAWDDTLEGYMLIPFMTTYLTFKGVPFAIDWSSGFKTQGIQDFLEFPGEKKWIVIGQKVRASKEIRSIFRSTSEEAVLARAHDETDIAFAPPLLAKDLWRLDASQIWHYEQDSKGTLQPTLILYSRFGKEQPPKPARSKAPIKVVSPVPIADPTNN